MYLQNHIQIISSDSFPKPVVLGCHYGDLMSCSWLRTFTRKFCSLRLQNDQRTKFVLRLRLALIKCFWSSPRPISIGQLHALLHFHLRPINDVVYIEPYLTKSERPHLRGSFTLRCLQRLSRPYIATQLCPWQDNWCTRGTSIPVLSY